MNILISKILHSDKGSSSLEWLLFAPLALLLMFVGVDAGLNQLEHAELEDILRSSLQADTTCTTSYLQVNHHQTLSLQENDIPTLLSCIRDYTIAKLMEHSILSKNLTPEDFRLTVKGVILDVNQLTGKIIGQNLIEPSGESVSGTLMAEEIMRSEQIQDLNARLDSELSIERAIEPSRLALTLPPVLGVGVRSSEKRYHPKSLMLLGELLVKSNGVNPTYAKFVYGGEFGFQLYQLVPSRIQLEVLL